MVFRFFKSFKESGGGTGSESFGVIDDDKNIWGLNTV